MFPLARFVRLFAQICLAGALVIPCFAQKASLSPVANRITAPVENSARVTLHGSVHPLANAQNDRGAAPASLPMTRLQIWLKRSPAQETALHELIRQMQTPGDPHYHHWLTPAEFGREFGPSDQDIAAIESWLASQGFGVKGVKAGKQVIEFSGSAAQVQAAFHTAIHKYEVNGQIHYANASAPQIPAALAPVIGGFVSLNDFPLRHYSRILGKATYDPRTDKATPQWTYPESGGTMSNVLSPADFAVQYDLNPLYSAGIDGSGETIAIIDDSNVNIDLVNQFRSTFGLPANPPRVIIDGNDPGIDGINNPDYPNYDSGETYLDVEWAGAVAPNATIDLVIAADTYSSDGLFLAAEDAVYSNLAPVISVSYGNCEYDLGNDNPFLSNLWEQAAAQGITVVVAAGDSGSDACASQDVSWVNFGLNVNGFASTPYNVAVGGTDFYYSSWNQGASAVTSQMATYWNSAASNTPAVSLKEPVPEQPWNDSQYGLDVVSYYTDKTGSTDTTVAAGSGGASSCAIATYDPDGDGSTDTCTSGYAKPSWQAGTGVPADNVRDIPDVSLFAANGLNESYYPVCASDGDCQGGISSNPVQITGVGGTSAAAPAFAGIMALVDEKYGLQGQADFVLYPLAAQEPSAFHDVTVGTNTVPCLYSDSAGDSASPNCIQAAKPITLSDSSGDTWTEGELGTGTTPDYNAGTGYDLASGWGSVDAAVLLNDWGKVNFTGTATTLTPSETSFVHGTPITFSGSVTAASGMPTGNVALMTDSSDYENQGQTSFALSNGNFSSTFNLLPGGTYNIWGQYSGDGTNAPSASQKTQITVTPESSTLEYSAMYCCGTNDNYIPVAGQTIPFGTQIYLDAHAIPTSYYTQCVQPAAPPASCNSETYGYATGTATFGDNGAPINTSTLAFDGTAEYALGAYSAGAHSIGASYSGDASYMSSTASPISFTIAKANPDFQSSQQAATYTNGTTYGSCVGQESVLTFRAYSALTATSPTGTMTLVGAPAGMTTSAQLIEVQKGAGEADFLIPASLPAGTYNVTAAYSGDANYNQATTSASFTVWSGCVSSSQGAIVPTTITATASATATSPTAAITVNITVTGQAGLPAPTGQVEVGTYYWTLQPGTGVTSSVSGVLNSELLEQGTNVLVIYYSGDSNYGPSATELTIDNPLSDFSLTTGSPIVPVSAGNSATANLQLASMGSFTGTVNLTCTAPNGITCTPNPASATLTSDSNAPIAVTLAAAATAGDGENNVLLTATSGAYIHTLALDAQVTGGTPPEVSVTDSGDVTVLAGTASNNTTTLTISPVAGYSGTLDLSCAATTSPAGATAPTCSVPASVSLPGTLPASVVLTINTAATTTGGSYVFTVTMKDSVSAETVGTMNVNVTVHAPGFSLGNSGSLAIAPGATSGNTATITVTPAYGFTGTVNLSCAVTAVPAGATDPATCSVTSPVNLTGASAGTATLTVTTSSSTTQGSYTIGVAGTDAATGKITSTTTVNVTVAAAPSFSLNSGNNSTLTVSKGETGTATITINPSGGFAGTVNLSCAVTASIANPTDPPTCSIPASVDVTAGGATAMLTVNTTGSTSSMLAPWKGVVPIGGGAVFALVVFFGIPARRRNWRAILGVLCVIVAVGVIGCGGGSTHISGGGGGGTTSGNYVVTVNASAGNVTQSTTIQLIVN